jgi:hypothetical protein
MKGVGGGRKISMKNLYVYRKTLATLATLTNY